MCVYVCVSGVCVCVCVCVCVWRGGGGREKGGSMRMVKDLFTTLSFSPSSLLVLESASSCTVPVYSDSTFSFICCTLFTESN